ncbi:cation diffusion facilitator family transporter [Terriglobus roseus]|uniref:Cobalt-zinc-cadmium efflux system protein n=1 Tax=Terriglobus roseus TaxID=392734 RepID=A0A1G7P777_9BACT|nr:cation diffusion facilitator family transporter [Terriglobus roseus]SDF81469.1 cobalt-zinc-cadmium efflux system protein [Terriglobus roseus]
MAHDHSHAHHHHVHGPTSGKRLWVSLAVTLAFCAGEAIAGWVSHSLALLSDAGHNVSDAVALGLAAYAVVAIKRPAAGRHTYGHIRVSTLTALFNSSTLVLIALWIAIEAVGRFRNPEPIEGNLMIWVAAISVLMNTVIAVALAGDAKHSLNSRAAFIHMAGDALSAAAVVIAGIVVRYTGWLYADPIVSLMIAVFIFWSAIGIVREASDVLMEKAPPHLDPETLAARIGEIEPVCSVHDVHVWTVGEGRNLLSCHVALPANHTLLETTAIVSRIEKMLHDDFGIEHATIQPEEDGLCRMAHAATVFCSMEAHSHSHVH